MRDAIGSYEGILRTSFFDHVTFRASDFEAFLQIWDLLTRWSPTNVLDRKYFRSFYARDPTGMLIEYATDASGFAESDLMPFAHRSPRATLLG